MERAGIPYIAEFDPDFSLRRRQLWMSDVGWKYPNDTLIFVDGWDTVLLGSLREFEKLKLEDGILVAGSKDCWPDPERESEYGYIKRPWGFVQNSPVAGLGKNSARAIDWGWQRLPILEDSKYMMSAGDARFWTNLYLNSPFGIKIDSECRLCQIFYDTVPGELYMANRRVTNLVWGTKPLFLHANVRSVIPPALYDHLGVPLNLTRANYFNSDLREAPIASSLPV